MRRWLISIGILLLVTWFAFALTDVDLIPNGFTCLPYNPVSPLVEVTVKSPRVEGYIVERQFGCTFYYYESRGD